jgi:hypothetical protein
MQPTMPQPYEYYPDTTDSDSDSNWMPYLRNAIFGLYVVSTLCLTMTYSINPFANPVISLPIYSTCSTLIPTESYVYIFFTYIYTLISYQFYYS